MTRTLLDTGPLVAFLNRNDQWHDWAKAQMGALPPPLLTCEPVLTEVCFLIQRNGGQPADVLKKLQAGVIEVALEIETEAPPARFLGMARPGPVPAPVLIPANRVSRRKSRARHGARCTPAGRISGRLRRGLWNPARSGA